MPQLVVADWEKLYAIKSDRQDGPPKAKQSRDEGMTLPLRTSCCFECVGSVIFRDHPGRNPRFGYWLHGLLRHLVDPGYSDFSFADSLMTGVMEATAPEEKAITKETQPRLAFKSLHRATTI